MIGVTSTTAFSTINAYRRIRPFFSFMQKKTIETFQHLSLNETWDEGEVPWDIRNDSRIVRSYRDNILSSPSNIASLFV